MGQIEIDIFSFIKELPSVFQKKKEGEGDEENEGDDANENFESTQDLLEGMENDEIDVGIDVGIDDESKELIPNGNGGKVLIKSPISPPNGTKKSMDQKNDKNLKSKKESVQETENNNNSSMKDKNSPTEKFPIGKVDYVDEMTIPKTANRRQPPQTSYKDSFDDRSCDEETHLLTTDPETTETDGTSDNRFDPNSEETETDYVRYQSKANRYIARNSIAFINSKYLFINNSSISSVK